LPLSNTTNIINHNKRKEKKRNTTKRNTITAEEESKRSYSRLKDYHRIVVV